MTKSEMRFIRRFYINSIILENSILHRFAKPPFTLKDMKNRVREFEFVNYGYELKAYA